MPRPRVTVMEMIALVLFAGIIFGSIRIFDEERVRPDEWGYAVYLATLMCVTFGARSGRGGASFFRGVAIYGWVYLVAGLHLGLGVTEDYSSKDHMARRCFAALPMGALCGIASWFFSAVKPVRGSVDSSTVSP